MEHMHPISRRLSLAALLAAAAWLAACASLQSKPEDSVTERANARWQALIQGDMAKAYTYSTPGFRTVVNLEGFRGRTGIAGRWHAAQVVNVTCDTPERCKAVIKLEFSTLIPGFSKDRITTHIDETWLLEDGQWWIFQKV
jgi:hypothetical protein